MTSSLTVWHAPAGTGEEPAAAARTAAAWRVSTCQRELRIFVAEEAPPAAGTAFEVRRGWPAYEFLLRVATGLESAIPGETNILGQLRRSWAAHEAASGPAPALGAVARALFADAVLVRTRHLQGIGGRSYGTLVRMLLKPSRGARLLVAGAGSLAKSVLPAFASFESALYARRPEALSPALPARRFGCGEERTAIDWAELVCFCLPPHTERDAAWIDALHERPRPAVHLGLRRGAAGRWSELSELRTLDDVFELQRSQTVLRRARIARAAQACHELALHRGFGPARAPRAAAGAGAGRQWSGQA